MPFLCWIVTAYIVVLTVRALMSWFPPPRSGIMAQIASVCFDLTEPLLVPLRRVIPPAGMFDLSFLVLFFVFFLLRQMLCG